MTAKWPNERSCKRCSAQLTLDNSYRGQWYCKQCQRLRERGYRPARPTSSRVPNGDWSIETRLRYLDNRKREAGCADCGSTAGRMDFDHLPGTDKRFNISEAARTKEVPTFELIEELGKCETVCSDCHVKRTADRRRAEGPPQWGVVSPASNETLESEVSA